MESSIYRLRLQDILALCVMGLLFLGILMVQSAATNVTGQPTWQWTERGTRHIVFAAVALLTFFVVGHIDYSIFARGSGLRSLAFWLLVVAIVACAVVLIPHVGIDRNGARRWLPLVGKKLVFQPSEVGKWAVVLFLAWWIACRRTDIRRFFRGFLWTLAPVGVICLLVVIEDLGTAALIGLCALTICLAARVRLWHLMLILPPAMAAGWWFIHHKEYRWRRMTAFVDPFAAPRAEGYHMIQSLLSFATGGIFGRGLGNGIQKLGYLPEDTTDFIFAVICEELGIFGALLTILLYLGILWVAWQIIRQSRDSFGRLLAFGVASMIGLQALINMAVVTVSVPTKGLSLPLVSAGGTGLVITCAALGLLYSIARHPHAAEQDERAPAGAGWDLRSRDLVQAH